VFCFAGVGCSALRPAQGTLTPAMRTKHPPVVGYYVYKSQNKENFGAIFTLFFLTLVALRGFPSDCETEKL
jgi:hypothetical protein